MKKKAKSLVALLVVLTMLGALLSGCKAATSSPAEPPADNESSTNNSTDTPTQNAEDAQDEVEITLWANQYSPENLGPQYNPIADKIAEVTGVRISVADYSSGDSKEQLATMMASNDLPDIFYVPDSDTLNSLIEAGQVLNLNEHWNDENCPNMNGANPDATNRQRFLADTSYNGNHYAVLMYAGTGFEDQPSPGFYIPWEIYSEAGYPEIDSLDDLVDALETMRSVHETNADGQPVYGAGAWFADDGDWGAWCVGISSIFGDAETPYRAQNVTTGEIYNKIPIMNPDSLYWQGIRFYYELNQRGLLDPDSVTQKYDQWAEKAYSGRYLMIMPGWETAALKQNTEMSYIALPSFGDGMLLDWSGELSGSMYAISSTCQNPGKALQLLDYLWSPEGSRLVSSGIEGVAWEMVDGKAQYTQQRLDDELTLSKSELVKKYGESLGQLAGYALNVVSPLDGSTFNLKYTPEYKAKTLTEAEKDAMNYYGVSSIRDIYTKGDKNTVYRLGEYAGVMESMPDELSKNATDLSNFIARNYLSCVFAKDDAEFERQMQAMISGAADYNVEGLNAWYTEAFAKAASIVDPYLQ